jgi:uncharacterized membrane protein
MAKVQKSVEVDCPLSTVYNQWTQFEEFPRFMEGVKAVRQLDDKRLHWHAEIAGKDEQWESAIELQEPDRTIAWRSTAGAVNAGRVDFEPLGAERTRVHLTLEYEPQGATEKLGDLLGVVSRRVEGDLGRFKEFVEAHGRETGAWRGAVHGERVER